MIYYSDPEASDPKKDGAKLCANGFRFLVNLQHPPLICAYRKVRPFAIGGGLVVGFGANLLFTAATSRIGIGWAMLPFLLLVGLEAGVRFMPNIAWYLWGRRRDQRRLSKLEALAETREVEPLVSVRGRVVELLEFAALPDVSFEPRLFRVSERKYAMSMEARIVALLILAGLVASLFFGFAKPCVLMFASVLAFVWVLLLYSLFSEPTYYRVMPGRIDVVTFRTFGERPERVKSLNLTGTRICIDLTRTKQYVTLEGEGMKYEFDRSDTGNPLAFAIAVALAAKSTSPTPNIPMDALLG